MVTTTRSRVLPPQAVKRAGRKRSLPTLGRKTRPKTRSTAPTRTSNPRGAPEGHYPPVEQVTYPPGTYELAAFRFLRKKGDDQLEAFTQLNAPHVQQQKQVYGSVYNFDKYWLIELQWRLTDPETGITFLYNKTSCEKLRNVLRPEDMKNGGGTLAWTEVEPQTRPDRLGSWVVLGGEGSGRQHPTLPEQMQLAHGTLGAGVKQPHTDPFYCAHNAFSNVLQLSPEDDQRLRQHAGPKMHIKAYSDVVQAKSPYYRLVKVGKTVSKTTRSPPEKLKWLLDTTTRGGYKNEDPLHTGCMLVGVGGHVVGWDTRGGLIYDPYTEIKVALPATKEVVNALHLNQIDFFRVITNTHKQIERKKE
jgi:hypothetical protein